MRSKYFLIIGLGLFGCTNKNRTATPQEDSINSKPASSTLTPDEYNAFYNSDSTVAAPDLIIDFDCAVLIYPTAEDINEMKKEYGEEDFYIVADDNNWYQGKAIEKLDSVGIKTTTIDGDSLRFKGIEKTWRFDLKRDSLSGWNIILFNRRKGPQVISTVDITIQEIRDYFDIKE